MSFYFLYGTMNSGKSTRLLQQSYNFKSRGFNSIIIQSAINERDNGVESRIGLQNDADIIFDKSTSLKEEILNLIKKFPENEYKIVLVDEAQFLSKEQVNELFLLSVETDLIIECYGLKSDFRGKSFSGSKRLLELAELEQLDTVPCRCGAKARFNARFDKETGKIITTGPQNGIESEKKSYFYDPVCPKCFIKYGAEL